MLNLTLSCCPRTSLGWRVAAVAATENQPRGEVKPDGPKICIQLRLLSLQRAKNLASGWRENML